MATQKVAASERKPPTSASTISIRAVAAGASGENAESVMATTGKPSAREGVGELDRRRRIGREADRDERVAVARGADLLAGKGPDMVDEVRRNLKLAKGIGQIGGDREGAPQAEKMDRPGAGQDRDRALQILGDHGVVELGERERRGGAEALKQPGRAVGGLGPELCQALAVRRPALAQAMPEDLLQLRKTVIAQRLGEPDQCRGLDLGGLRDRGDGAEGDLVRMSQRIFGGAHEPRRQALAAVEQQRPEALEIPRRRLAGPPFRPVLARPHRRHARLTPVGGLFAAVSRPH